MDDLSKDPAGHNACSTRKVFAWVTFVSGLLFAGFDLWANGGNSVIGILAFAGTGPGLYGVARANHEYQVRKNGV